MLRPRIFPCLALFLAAWFGSGCSKSDSDIGAGARSHSGAAASGGKGGTAGSSGGSWGGAGGAGASAGSGSAASGGAGAASGGGFGGSSGAAGNGGGTGGALLGCSEECDPLLGLPCDPQTGKCMGGPCSTAALGRSYIGCDYYPTVTANSVPEQFHFAVAVSNTSSAPATVTVTKGATVVTQASVAGGSVKVIELPWIAKLKAAAAQNYPSNLSSIEATYRLRSTQPVSVYQFSPIEGNGPQTNDASLLLPVNT